MTDAHHDATSPMRTLGRQPEVALQDGLEANIGRAALRIATCEQTVAAALEQAATREMKMMRPLTRVSPAVCGR
ncbi:hypothetical protein D4Q52_14210 [Rhodopseudomonas palustris]|uniref:Uncharacterized protein n=1 Tax=Rhodopseudomonas palustris TaxID=1076 RepID=A0A418VCX5_RHOPL|nr:hypothetical protein D4Q52_14210 [Rhodopseudomonas palustris]